MQEINNEEFNKRRKMLGEVRYIQKLIEIDIEELNELTLQEKSNQVLVILIHKLRKYMILSI